MGRLLVIFLIPPIVAVLFFYFFHLKCKGPQFLDELISYSYVKHEVPSFTSYTFKLKPRKTVKVASSKGAGFGELVKNLKISVIKGKKTYLLIGPIFLEQGKVYNGIKFIGIVGNKVLIEVGGKVYEKNL